MLCEYVLGQSKTNVDVSEEYPWPRDINPMVASIYTYNELDMPNVSREAAFKHLINAITWSSYYPSASKIKVPTADGNLQIGTEFTFTTFGTTDVEATVEEFVECKRLSWRFKSAGMEGYHSWTILDRKEGGIKIITEESQIGVVPFLFRAFIYPVLKNGHDSWLSGLMKVACF